MAAAFPDTFTASKKRMGKKRNKKAIIITAILMLAGILLILAGAFGGRISGLFQKTFDFRNIGPEYIGKPVEMNILVKYDDVGLERKTLQELENADGTHAMILLDFSAMGSGSEQLYYSKYYQHITIQGTLTALDEDGYREVAEAVYNAYDVYYYEHRSKGEWTDVTLDEFHKVVMEEMLNVIPYSIEVRSISISSFDWVFLIPAGALLFLVSLILEICFVFRLKKRIVLPVVFGIIIIVPSVLLFDHIRTMLTVRNAGNGLYTMKNLECTDTQGMLGSGAASADELLDWIFDNHLYGIRLPFDIEEFGCAAFAAVTPEGEHLFGRNFDFPETDTLLIHSHPDGCYESIGNADLGVLGVGNNFPISPDSPAGRLIMVITPYLVVDGMNEKGVGAGILQLNLDPTHQDNGKPDLLIFCAVRAVLDKCASVDEALALLDSYDMHSDLGGTYHLFITDRTGRYVVVEWLDGEMVVVEHPCCTNSVVAPGKYYDKGAPDGRLPAMEEYLSSGRQVTGSEAMDLLKEVRNDKMTEWSCVYNLDDFTVSICLDNDFSKVYTFSADDLR